MALYPHADCNNLTLYNAADHQHCFMERGIKLPPNVAIFLSSLIFVLAVAGNTMVILVLLYRPKRNDPTNLFIVNLAASDLVLAICCIPFTMVTMMLEDFMFGAAMCVALRYLQAVSIAVNCFTLVAISLERYYAICEPFRSRRWQTLKHAYTVIALTWFGALVVTVPVAATQRLVPLRTGKHACREVWPYREVLELTYTLLLDAIILVIPITVMSVAYILIAQKLWTSMDHTRTEVDPTGHVANGRYTPSTADNASGSEVSGRHLLRDTTESSPYQIRVSNYERNLANKRKVVKMLLVVVLEYFICWTPIFIVNTWIVVNYEHARQRISPMTKSLFHLLSYISSCCNPITYCFMNSKFRQGFLTAFRCCARPTSTRTFNGRDYPSSTNRFALQRRDILG